MVEFLLEIISPGHPFAIGLGIFYMIYLPAVFIGLLYLAYRGWKHALYGDPDNDE